ncbi:prephenate dehydrogenase [Paludicola sp. MB14-C6]|uniref:prephenate dehydrogenase n=1 Tax=Paludihabitans sp. MB14-C6 TaxID=3070656 RepID=UPI0027DD3D6E|nr:prephenate dehydrogenase [Paludicola sp. MB14-C6]WMJ22527.1 prephenate dehydrogenase [Paludicola sp. MB14-C6]
MNQNQTILIVGLGLIGGSYAKGLKEKGYAVTAIDVNQQSIDYAVENHIIDSGATNSIDFIRNADVIICALYPTTMIHWMKENQQFFKSGIFITDVSGVKCNVVDVIQSNLRNDVEFIASHPMAGKEVSGVQFSDSNIFKQANFIITPTEKNTERGIAFARELAETIQFNRIVTLSPQKHDEMIGYLSQLTHAIAVSLMNANDNPHLKEYTGDSFRDLTRIAKINEIMWSELFFLNKDILISEIDSFQAELSNLKYKLQNNDEKGLKQLFIQSTERRKQFDKE